MSNTKKESKPFNLEEAIKLPPLTNLFDEGINAEIDEKEKSRQVTGVDRFPLSPSQLGGCSRKMAIELAEFSNLGIYPKIKYDARSTRRFTRGYDIEYSLLRQLNKYVPIQQGYKQQHIEMARTSDNKHVIGGSMDVVLIDGDEAMIVDIKSKGTYYSNVHTDKFEEEFQEIASYPGVHEFGDKAYYIEDIEAFYEAYPKDNFISRYFIQLNAYGYSPWARTFKHNSNPNINGISHVSLLFENKNNHILAELRFRPSPKLYEETIKRALHIYDYVVIEKKDPALYPAEFTLGSVNCRLCDRREVCWADARHPYNGPKKKWPKDVERLENADELEKAYEKYKKALTATKEFEKIEAELITKLSNTKETKVRFSDGHVYDLKYLKTPKPHLVIRRGKL